MVRHDNYAKDWGAIGSWDLTPSAIYYKHQTNSRTVHMKLTGSGARREGETSEYGIDIDGKVQGGRINEHTRNGAA